MAPAAPPRLPACPHRRRMARSRGPPAAPSHGSVERERREVGERESREVGERESRRDERERRQIGERESRRDGRLGLVQERERSRDERQRKRERAGGEKGPPVEIRVS